MQRFSGKVALVTGGASGLGKATAVAFGAEGAKVVIAGRREELGREVEAQLRSSGIDSMFVRTDITDEAQVGALIEGVQKTYGRLDYAYNNAWSVPQGAPLAELAIERFDQELALLRGTFLCMKYEIAALASTGGGAIVNCSSMATQLAQPGTSAYAAAKSAMEMLVRTAAHECAGKNIRINSICAGGIETPGSTEYVRQLPPAELEKFFSRIALRRLGRVDEIAQSVLYLCSEAASYITGINLVIDGGLRLT